MDKRIVINADDFGLCEGVNKAVAQAHTDGVLTSATIMVNMSGAAEAFEIAREMPSLAVGVHLNLFEGRAVSRDSRVDCLLNNDGSFAYSPFQLSILSAVSYKIRNAIRVELAAQIQSVFDNGLTPTHLDSHKHIHSSPSIFPIVCNLAGRFKIPAVRWVFEPKQLSQSPWPLPSQGGRQRATIVRTMAKINRIQNPRFIKTDALLGVAHTGKINVNFFKAVSLYHSAQTTEVMTHPGFPDGIDADQTRLVNQRELELEALCSERTKQYLKDAAIELVHYGKL